MYCKKCGNEIFNNEDSCRNCGTPVTRHKNSDILFPNGTNPNYSNGIQNPYPANTKNPNKIAVAAAVGTGVLILAGGAFIVFGRGCSCGSDDNDYSSVSIYDNAGSISPVVSSEKTTSAKTVSDETSSETIEESIAETIEETSSETIAETIAETEQETAAETSDTDSLWEETENSGSNSNYKEAYINELDNIASSPDVTTVTFTLYDMDSSGIPELAVISGTCEADYELVFYSYANGEAKRVSEVFSGFHTFFVREKDTGQFCTQWGQMGTGGISWYTFDGTKVEKEREVNSIDYDSDPNAFSKYGNFANCFYEMLFYSDYKNRWITWTYSEDGSSNEYSGKNYDYINNY